MGGMRVSSALTMNQQMVRKVSNRGRGPLAIEKMALIMSAPEIAASAMINIGGNLRIMKGEVTAGLFMRVMKNYRIRGDEAETLRAILTDPELEKVPLNFISLFDARKFARKLSAVTGRTFSVPTKNDITAKRQRLSGSESNMTWTDTRLSTGTFLLLGLDNFDRAFYPWARIETAVIRLVEHIR